MKTKALWEEVKWDCGNHRRFVAFPCARRRKLSTRYHRATATRAILNQAVLLETGSMASDSSPRKDTLKVEKLSLLILTLCVVVLVGLLVFKPF